MSDFQGSTENYERKVDVIEEYLHIDDSLVELEKNKDLVRMEMNIVEFPIFSRSKTLKVDQIKKYYFSSDKQSFLEVVPAVQTTIPGELEERIFIALLKIFRNNGYNQTFYCRMSDIFENMKIVVLDGYGLNPGDLSWEEMRALGELTVYDRTAPAELLERSAGAEVLITNKTVITAEDMAALPALKYIGVLATGYNIVDIQAAKARGIIVTNIPAYSTASVAQMVFAHILNITQRVGHYAYANRHGRWANNPDFCYWDTDLVELDGKKLGIIGLGNTGQATARIAAAFGMQVCAYTSKPQSQLPGGIRKMELDELFRECDVVSLHCPLTPDTKELVNAARLALMKPTAILINTGRGPLVNEKDLADALNKGVIAAAGLDVLSSEPPQYTNPLLTAKNCFITPHIAWATKEARVRLMRIAVGNLKGFIKGEIVNNVAE